MSETPKSPVSKRFRVLLYTSIAFNLLILGVATGIVFNSGPDRGPRDNNLVRGGTPFVRALDGGQRDDLRSHLRSRLDGERGGAGGQRSDRDQIYLDIAGVMRADPFDQQAMVELFDAHTDNDSERMRRGQSEFRDFLLTLDDDARQAFADRLEADIKDRNDRRPPPPPLD